MGNRVRTRDESANAGTARSALRVPFLAQHPSGPRRPLERVEALLHGI